MGVDLDVRPRSGGGYAAPCAFRGCDRTPEWRGTPICGHPQKMCSTHMLRFHHPHCNVRCIACHQSTPAEGIIWKRIEP